MNLNKIIWIGGSVLLILVIFAVGFFLGNKSVSKTTSANIVENSASSTPTTATKITTTTDSSTTKATTPVMVNSAPQENGGHQASYNEMVSACEQIADKQFYINTAANDQDTNPAKGSVKAHFTQSSGTVCYFTSDVVRYPTVLSTAADPTSVETETLYMAAMNPNGTGESVQHGNESGIVLPLAQCIYKDYTEPPQPANIACSDFEVLQKNAGTSQYTADGILNGISISVSQYNSLVNTYMTLR